MSAILDNLAPMAARLDALVAAHQARSAACYANMNDATAKSQINRSARAGFEEASALHFLRYEAEKALGANFPTDLAQGRTAFPLARAQQVRDYFQAELNLVP